VFSTLVFFPPCRDSFRGVFSPHSTCSALCILILPHELTLILFLTFPHVENSIHTFPPHFRDPYFAAFHFHNPHFFPTLRSIFLNISHSLPQYSLLSHFSIFSTPASFFLRITCTSQYLCPLLSQFIVISHEKNFTSIPTST
jgi:hypothetical protein